jgi:hypothetical protein
VDEDAIAHSSEGPLLQLISSSQRKSAACELDLMCMDELGIEYECPNDCMEKANG